MVISQIRYQLLPIVLSGLRAFVILFSLFFVSCTNVSFQQFYTGPKGINFSYGSCLVDEIRGPISKRARIHLTSVTMEYLRKISDSVVLMSSSDFRHTDTPSHINSVSQESTSYNKNITSFKEAKEYLHKNGDSILRLNFLDPSGFNPQSVPSVLNSELIDSLRKNTCFYYLVNIEGSAGRKINGGFAIGSNFHNNLNNQQYFDNRAIVEITIFEIQSRAQVYYQKIIADEMVNTDYDGEGHSGSSFVFTRSSGNIMKNALVRGLRSLKRHSLKITQKNDNSIAHL